MFLILISGSNFSDSATSTNICILSLSPDRWISIVGKGDFLHSFLLPDITFPVGWWTICPADEFVLFSLSRRERERRRGRRRRFPPLSSLAGGAASLTHGDTFSGAEFSVSFMGKRGRGLSPFPSFPFFPSRPPLTTSSTVLGQKSASHLIRLWEGEKKGEGVFLWERGGGSFVATAEMPPATYVQHNYDRRHT